MTKSWEDWIALPPIKDFIRWIIREVNGHWLTKHIYLMTKKKTNED